MPLLVPPPVKPMLAKAATKLPVGADLFYEPKWDGFRCVVFRDGDEVELGSRNDRPLTRYFPELVELLRSVLPERCVVDGELARVHLTPLTDDPAVARDWFTRFEGAGFDGVMAKPDLPYEQDK